MMDFLFVYFISWIVLSRFHFRSSLRILLTFHSLAFSSLFLFVACNDPGSVSEEYLLKSHKVIQAVPNVLRRMQTTTSSGLPEDWDCHSVGACDDTVGYEAIRGLHRQLDDDANGSIDVAETDEFLRDELQYENGRHKERHKEFHGNDNYINVDELWQAWKMSEVHNWTVDETVEWLITQVDLPQYEHNFRNNGVTGASLPLLAQNTHNYISQNLGIKDSIHKQKVALKAMDVVLFGRAKYHNYLKDVLLALSLAIAAGGIWFAFVQHKHSQTHMSKMMKDMEALQKAEDSLLDLQKELSKARQEQEIVSIEKQDLERRLQDEIITAKRCLEHTLSSEGSVDSTGDHHCRLQELEQELSLARRNLSEAEKKLGARQWVAPLALQHWLQLTHELEQRSYNAKRVIAEQQLQAAKEGCEKLSKKRDTLLGAFRIAHGNSIDDIDERIVKAKAALYEVTTDLQERMHRWKQIEMLVGFPIILNPGIACLESLLSSTLGSTHSGLHRSSSDVTIRDESPPPYAGIVPGPLAAPVITPPPSYSKASPSSSKKLSEFPSAPSRVVYPKECYRPLESMSSFDTDSEDLLQIAELKDQASVMVESMVESPTVRPVFCVGDSSDVFMKSKEIDSLVSSSKLSTEHSNGKVGDFVRKISASILEKRKKPNSLAIEALKKSASSSSIVDNDGASSESSSSVISEDKVKKKKFFQTLRHRKPKS